MDYRVELRLALQVQRVSTSQPESCLKLARAHESRWKTALQNFG